MISKFKRLVTNYPKIYEMFRKIYFGTENIKRYFRIIVSTPFLLLPIRNNKIVICNYFGKGYGDNGKYISEEIIKQDLDYDIVWLLKKELIGTTEFPQEVRTVKYESLKGLYELATAKIWIDNSRKTFYPLKRKEQYYIQTWHGSLGMKKVEKDAEDTLSKNYINVAKKDSKMANLFISNGNHISNLYKNSFWYNGEILVSGSPRNDIIFDNSDSLNRKIRTFFKINDDIKIALYAPTFRKSNDLEVYNLDYERCITTLKRRFGGEWIILLRLHPNISESAKNIRYAKNVLNATKFDDMQELLAISDVLITDYSSSMFDFTLTLKPCFIYASDIDSYMSDRNFYFDINKLPFPIGENTDKLVTSILRFDEKKYQEELKAFFYKQGIIEDGFASKRVVERIKAIIEGVES